MASASAVDTCGTAVRTVNLKAPAASFISRRIRHPTCVEINQCVGCTRQFFTTESFLGDDAAVLAPSSGEEPDRHAIEQAVCRWRGG